MDSKSSVCNVDFAIDIKDNSEFGCIISVCKQLFHNSFHNFHVEFNGRQVNKVVHELMEITSYIASSHIHIELPSCI